MERKVIESLAVSLLALALLIQTGGADKIYPKNLQAVKSANLEPTRASTKITISPNEISKVEEPLDIETEMENEEFCDSLEILACCVEAEAGNQDLLGKRLVADVILNRVDSPRFPNTIEEVVSQKYHFTTFWDGTMARIVPSDETFKAVQMELDKRTDSEILFFTAGDYNTYCVPAYRHGDHYFGY
jgi:N-acetylmuramoyl-L-alanine amidase